MRALDEAGNIGEHEVAPVDLDHAEARMERRERIVGDLGLGGRDRGEKGRFARVGQADQPGVGDQLQPQDQGALDSLLARIGATRRAVGRGGEMGVAEAAVAARGDDDALAHLGEVGEQRAAFLVDDLGSDRNFQHRVGARARRRDCGPSRACRSWP